MRGSYQNRYNAGKGAALKRGLIECLKFNPDVIITLDGDGSTPGRNTKASRAHKS